MLVLVGGVRELVMGERLERRRMGKEKVGWGRRLC